MATKKPDSSSEIPETVAASDSARGLQAPGTDSPAERPSQPAGDIRAELAVIAQTGNQNRLSPSEEDKATRLMRECMVVGTDGIAAALDAMPRLPWILGVRAIESAWADLAADSRTQVIAGLGKMTTDNGYRLRLSVARSLARIDLPMALQIAAAVCGSMWNRDTGTLSPEHSKLIGNVFIGRGKPWVLQLPLANAPEDEAESLAACVVFSAFNVNSPPITQLSILRYVAAQLARMHENLIGMVARSVGKWNGKWQAALRTEIAQLPDPIQASMKPAPAEGGVRERDDERSAATGGRTSNAGPSAGSDAEATLPPELEERFKLASESGDTDAVEAATREINAWREAQRIARLEAIDADDDDDDDESEEDGKETEGGTGHHATAREQRGRQGRDRKERPPYVPRDHETRGGAGFNYSAAIKQLDAYVTGLRNELATAQARLRKSDDEGRRGRRESADRPILSPTDGNLSPDELKRLVIQLENRCAELKSRVEELTIDSEARALAMTTGAAEGSPDSVTQLRTLLALKLQEDYADFLTLEKESPDAVVQQHYRGLIRHVFEVLAAEQVPLHVPEEPVVIPPLPPPVSN